MMRLCSLLLTAALLTACAAAPPPPAVAETPAPTARPYANLAQVMRGIPFVSSNIIFDTQTIDPGAPKTPAEHGVGATQQFASVYGGWQEVENNALAIAESATLMVIPGRSCENGRPVPIDRADFRQYADGLAEAGMIAYRAAQKRDLDAMVDVSGTLSVACANCHDVYRDKENDAERCIAAPAASAD